jgi:prefoldin subunit 5
VTAQQKVDALIDETATRYFDGMTVLERDITAIDTTLSGLRAIAKALDRLDRRLDEMDEKLDTLTKGLAKVERSHNDEAIDVLAGGLGLLRKKIRTMNKKRKKRK